MCPCSGRDHTRASLSLFVAPRAPQPLGRCHVHNKRLWIDDHRVKLRGGFDRHIALPHVVCDRFNRAVEWITIAPSSTRTQAKRFTGLEVGDQGFGVGLIGLPLAAQPEMNLVAGGIEPAAQTPGVAMGAIGLRVDGEMRARADDDSRSRARRASGRRRRNLVRSSCFSTRMGYLTSSCSLGLLWVSPSLEHTIAVHAVLGRLRAPTAAERAEQSR